LQLSLFPAYWLRALEHRSVNAPLQLDNLMTECYNVLSFHECMNIISYRVSVVCSRVTSFTHETPRRHSEGRRLCVCVHPLWNTRTKRTMGTQRSLVQYIILWCHQPHLFQIFVSCLYFVNLCIFLKLCDFVYISKEESWYGAIFSYFLFVL